MGGARWRRCYSFFFFNLLFFSASLSWAQRLGEAVAKEGDPTYQRLTDPSPQLIDLGHGVESQEQLRTQEQAPSKLEMLLSGGPKLVMSEEVELQLTKPGGVEVVVEIRKGTSRVLASSDLRIVNPPSGAEGRARATEYIVSCGPSSIIADSDLCLFVGVHGQTEVISTTAPGRPSVLLDPSQYTYIRRGQPPTSPQVLEVSFFQYLLEKTTIVGTGDLDDRLRIDIQKPIEIKTAGFPPQLPCSSGLERCLPPQRREPSQPPKVYGSPLPLPPPPPRF
jgi:hypothetical protein